MKNPEIFFRCYRFVFTALFAALLLIVIVATTDAQKRSSRHAVRPKTQTARIEITKYGYEPVTFALKRGVHAKVIFLRTTDETCATEIVFPTYGIRRDLPLNQAVTLSFTPNQAGEFSFTCGMGMNRGKLIVR